MRSAKSKGLRSALPEMVRELMIYSGQEVVTLEPVNLSGPGRRDLGTAQSLNFQEVFIAASTFAGIFRAYGAARPNCANS